MMRSNSLIASLLSLFGFSVSDLFVVCSRLDVSEFAAVYFIRRNCVFRLFGEIADALRVEYVRACASSKHPNSVKLKLYIPAAVKDELIDCGIAEYVDTVEGFFAAYNPERDGNHGEYTEDIEEQCAERRGKYTLDYSAAYIVPECDTFDNYIGLNGSSHACAFEYSDFTIEYNAEDLRHPFVGGVSVKSENATVYDLHTLAQYFTKSEYAARRVLRACAECGENGARVLNGLFLYCELENMTTPPMV